MLSLSRNGARRRPRTALVLGSGGIRTVCHVGLFKVLREEGIPIDMVVGSSGGSLFGAAIALGTEPDVIERWVLRYWRRELFRDYGYRQLFKMVSPRLLHFDENFGILRGEAVRRLLGVLFGHNTFDDTVIPLRVVATDLQAGEPVVLREGSIADAVRASSAIPGILSPLRLGGRNLVDGAVVEPLPIAAAAALGPHRVLAGNVLKPPASRAIAPRPLPRPRRKGVRSAVRDRVERWLLRQAGGGAAVGDEAPNRLEVVMRSFHVMQYRLAAAAYPDAGAIEPEVGRFGWFDFPRVEEIVDEGYRAYRARFPRA